MAHTPVNPVDVTLRPWTHEDAKALARLADDRDVWLNLRDRFPRPFTAMAADLWLADHITDLDARDWTQRGFAIWWRDELTGGVHLRRREDVHHICADLTFWVGRPFWGRGIATAAVREVTARALDAFGLERVQAFVFDWSPAAARVPEAAHVLQAAGYTLEGRLRHYVLKDGQYGDALLYAQLRSTLGQSKPRAPEEAVGGTARIRTGE